MSAREHSEPGGSVPRPDPTVLTTEQLHREISALREAMEAKVAALASVQGEKFRSIEHQLALAEQHRIEQKKDTKDAVDAALISQKEAVREQTIASDRAIAKSENTIIRQLEQLGATFNATNEGIRNILDDLKNRVTSVEQQKAGAKEDRGSLYAALAGLVALIAIGMFFFGSRTK